MKFGAHSYLWTERWSDRSLGILERARSLGLELLEIGVGDDVRFTPALTGKAARDLGLELAVSPGGLWHMDCDISLADRYSQRRGLEWHRRILDLAAELGAVAYAGAIYGHPGRVEPRLPTEEEYQRVAEHLHSLGEYAASLGLRLVLEPMSHFRTHLVNRPEQLVRLLTLADHPALGALFDTYHMVTELRDYAAGVRSLAPWLWGLHACESDRGVPGGGLVPWRPLFAALADIGFDGYVCMESYRSGPDGFAPTRGLFGDPCPDPDAFVRQGLAFLRSLTAAAASACRIHPERPNRGGPSQDDDNEVTTTRS